jgi:hypothetical protein
MITIYYRLFIAIFAVSLVFTSYLLVENNLDNAQATSTKKELKEMGNEAKRTAEKGAEKLEELSKKIRSGFNSNNHSNININNITDDYRNEISFADELRELSQLKQQGIITEEEFTEMKEDAFKNNKNDDDFSISIELKEFAKLKDEGIITEEEFTEMKEDLIG